MKPIEIDKNHCRIEDKIKLIRYDMYGPEYELKTVKCNFEYNAMHGMEECNICGMTRG